MRAPADIWRSPFGDASHFALGRNPGPCLESGMIVWRKSRCVIWIALFGCGSSTGNGTTDGGGSASTHEAGGSGPLATCDRVVVSSLPGLVEALATDGCIERRRNEHDGVVHDQRGPEDTAYSAEHIRRQRELQCRPVRERSHCHGRIGRHFLRVLRGTAPGVDLSFAARRWRRDRRRVGLRIDVGDRIALLCRRGRQCVLRRGRQRSHLPAGRLQGVRQRRDAYFHLEDHRLRSHGRERHDALRHVRLRPSTNSALGLNLCPPRGIRVRIARANPSCTSWRGARCPRRSYSPRSPLALRNPWNASDR